MTIIISYFFLFFFFKLLLKTHCFSSTASLRVTGVLKENSVFVGRERILGGWEASQLCHLSTHSIELLLYGWEWI